MSNNRMVLDSLAELRSLYNIYSHNLLETSKLETLRMLLNYKIIIDTSIIVVIPYSNNYSKGSIAGAIRGAARELNEPVVVSTADSVGIKIFFENANQIEEVLRIIKNIFAELIRQSYDERKVVVQQKMSHPNFESEIIAIYPQQNYSSNATQPNNLHSPFMKDPNNVAKALSYTTSTYDSSNHTVEKKPFITAHSALQKLTQFRHEIEIQEEGKPSIWETYNPK